MQRWRRGASPPLDSLRIFLAPASVARSEDFLDQNARGEDFDDRTVACALPARQGPRARRRLLRAGAYAGLGAILVVVIAIGGFLLLLRARAD